MGNTNINWIQLSDAAIVKQIGDYIRHERLEQNITQSRIAEMAGLNRWTIGQIENGESITLMSLIQVLRALDRLHVLKAFEYQDKISPLEYARLKKKEKKRARNKKDGSRLKNDLGW